MLALFGETSAFQERVLHRGQIVNRKGPGKYGIGASDSG
jgi:hypothetical protein